METHVKVVAILNIIFGCMTLVAGAIAVGVMMFLGAASGQVEGVALFSLVSTFIGVIFLITSVPQIVGGIGLLGMSNWARILILVLAALSLLNIPFGTILGIYTFWALLNGKSEELFSRRAAV